MSLMISKTVSWPAPATTHADAAVEAISYATGECGLGRVLIARSVWGVCAIAIGADRDALEADLAARFPKARLIANEAVVHDDLAKLIRFVNNPSEGLHLPLDMRGTSFQHRVWEKLRAIPVGRTVTYMELARWITRSLAPAPPIRSHWPFLATASCAAMAIWRTTAGASSASVN